LYPVALALLHAHRLCWPRADEAFVCITDYPSHCSTCLRPSVVHYHPGVHGVSSRAWPTWSTEVFVAPTSGSAFNTYILRGGTSRLSSRCGHLFWRMLAIRLLLVHSRCFPPFFITRGMYGYLHSFAHHHSWFFLIRGFQHGGHMVGMIRRVRVAVL
jgi:hypothetical protein